MNAITEENHFFKIGKYKVDPERFGPESLGVTCFSCHKNIEKYEDCVGLKFQILDHIPDGGTYHLTCFDRLAKAIFDLTTASGTPAALGHYLLTGVEPIVKSKYGTEHAPYPEHTRADFINRGKDNE